ncbi:MAG: hypothetical protein ACREKR_05810 [Candidatus Methylomirabilales bacterium]
MTTNRKAQSTKPFLYRTTDPGLAAALMALGFALVGLDDRGQAVYFTFPVSPMLLGYCRGYCRGQDTSLGVALRHGYERVAPWLDSRASYEDMGRSTGDARMKALATLIALALPVMASPAQRDPRSYETINEFVTRGWAFDLGAISS